jgi:hypothetical protein
MPKLIYPGDEGFWDILHSTLPPNWTSVIKGNNAYFAPDVNGILQPINEEDLDQYDDEHGLNELDEDEFYYDFSFR